MSWNYRVFKHVYKDEEYFQVHEVFYDDQGNIQGWSAEEVAALGSNPTELRSDLGMMLQALDRPILDAKELEKEK